MQPEKAIQCPCGEHELSLKKLTELHFTEIEEGEEKVYGLYKEYDVDLLVLLV